MPSKQISFADINTEGVMNVLISFDTLIDIDFGILVLISRRFFDTSVFNKEFFDENSDVEDMKRTVYTRECINPLELCLKDKSLADDFYNQFITQYYDDILNLSMITDLGKTIKLFSSNGVHCTISVDKEVEEKLIKRLKVFKDISVVYRSEIKDLDVYNQFIFKSLEDKDVRYCIDSIRDKTIYVANYKFNTVEENGKIKLKENMNYDIMASVMRNRFAIIDLYSNEV